MRSPFRCLAALLLCASLHVAAVTLPLHTAIVPFVSGLSSPIDIVTPPDGSGRMFVVQQSGEIRIVENGAVVGTPFLSLTSSTITSGGERGLLSLAFHPNYQANGYFFVYYTRAGDAALTIARYSRSSANPRLADPASGQVILTIPHSDYANHNGGKLLFGPDDGYLYSTHGDGGSGNDPLQSGQSLATLLGKLLRIDVDNGTPYSIPADNPFATTAGARPEIFAYGLRNTWRMSFDRLTGDLFLGDVGQDNREEIDFIAAGTPGGQNFGWRVWEGTRCNTAVANTSQCAAVAQTPPILEYEHNAGGAGTGPCGGSVSGGVRYRGSAIPELYGRYVFADYCTGRIWTAAPAGAAWERATFVDTGLNIAGFGEDAFGEVYFAAGGTIYKLVAEEAQATMQTDVSGDARADLVWQNAATGTTALWLMNGLAATSAAVLVANSGWRVTHMGDFNGDGRQDLVWRNAITGETALWLMNGSSVIAAAMISSDPALTVTHVADFDGNGRADLVLRNTLSGQTSMWLMNGTAVSASYVVLADAAWLVTHVADLNGDGKADLVWRNEATGQTAVWTMNGATALAAAVISSDRNWHVTHAGDLNGDLRADLVWRNTFTGATAAWLMNGIAATSSAVLLGDGNWGVQRLADLGGDGKADIVWRNRTNGYTAVWTMSGLASTAAAVIYANPAWRVTNTGDFDGDGRADLVWRNDTTGETALWRMNGTSVLSSALVFGDAQWSVTQVNASR